MCTGQGGPGGVNSWDKTQGRSVPGVPEEQRGLQQSEQDGAEVRA